MRTSSYSVFRRNLAATLDSVTDDRSPVLITRCHGKAAALLMSLEDYASYEETGHLLLNPSNAARVLEATATLDHAGGTEHVLIE